MTIVIFVLLSICVAAFLYFGVPLIYSGVARVLLMQKAKKSNSLVLTFDDGLTPGVELATAILDVLAQHGVKATFFLLGKHLPGREAVVRRIKAEGHEIGAHGYAHLNYWKVSPFRALTDLKRGWQAIDVALGNSGGTYPFRPPYGALNLVCLLYLWIRRVPIVYWSFDLGDAGPSYRQIVQRVSALAKEPGGAVVLAHCWDRIDEGINRMVVEGVRSVLKLASKRGMPIVTVSELFRGRKQSTN